MSDEKEKPGIISFDTESSTYEEIKNMVANTQFNVEPDSPYFIYKNKFQKELDIFNDTYKRNQILLERISEQNASIVGTATKIQSILAIVDQNASKIEQYKKDYDEVLQLIVSLSRSDLKSRDILKNLRKTINELSETVRNGETFLNSDEESAIQVAQDVACLKAEFAVGNSEVIELQNQLMKYNEQIASMKSSVKELTESAENLQKLLDQKLSSHTTIQAKIEECREQCQLDKAKNIDFQKQYKENSFAIKQKQETIFKMKNMRSELVYNQMDSVAALRTKKSNILSRSKHLQEVINGNSQKNDNIIKKIGELKQSDDQLIMLNKKHSELEIMGEQLVIENESVQEEIQQYAKEKVAIQGEIKQLKEQMIDMKHQETYQSNENYRVKRNAQAIIHDRSIIKKRLQDEETATAEIVIASNKLNQEKYVEKVRAQDTKIRLRNYEVEIENKEQKISRLFAQEQLVSDEINDFNQKTIEDSRFLEQYSAKIIQQDKLNDDHRKERNYLKRKLIWQVEENSKLIDDNNDLKNHVTSLQEKLRKAELNVATEHFRFHEIKVEITELSAKNSELRNLVSDANKSISSMKAQAQLYSHILDECQHDMTKIKKELHNSKTSTKSIEDQLYQRNKLVQELRYETQNITNSLEQGYFTYARKKEETESLEEEALKFLKKQHKLQGKFEKYKALESTSRRLQMELQQEYEKTTAMTREFGTARNVHRWQVYEKVNPNYARNLHYYGQLTEKLDIAHRELIQLQKERDDLKLKVNEKKNYLIPNGASKRAEHSKTVEYYKKVLAEKDQEVAEMMEQLAKANAGISTLTKKTLGVRQKITSRRAAGSGLRKKLLAAGTNISEASGETLFLTECAPTVRIGGGFVLHETPRRPINTASGFREEAGLCTPRSKSTIIARPTTARKRPKTSYI